MKWLLSIIQVVSWVSVIRFSRKGKVFQEKRSNASVWLFSNVGLVAVSLWQIIFFLSICLALPQGPIFMRCMVRLLHYGIQPASRMAWIEELEVKVARQRWKSSQEHIYFLVWTCYHCFTLLTWNQQSKRADFLHTSLPLWQSSVSWQLADDSLLDGIANWDMYA